MKEVSPKFFPIIDDIKINIKTAKKVNETESVVFLDDYRLEVFGFKQSKHLTQKKIQLLNRSMVLLINNEILHDGTPDGVYTWILYKTRNSHLIVFSPVESLVEFSNKHSNMNIIAYERGFIPTRMEFDQDYEGKVKKTGILYAGEVKKRNNRLTFNFLSGTYSLKIKNELSKQKAIDLERNIWFPSLVTILDNLDFPISECQTSHSTQSYNIGSVKNNLIVRYTSRDLVTWKNIPFHKENYIVLQPFLQGRFVITNNPAGIVKQNRVYYNNIIHYNTLPPKYKGDKPKFPEELKNLVFLDEL